MANEPDAFEAPKPFVSAADMHTALRVSGTANLAKGELERMIVCSWWQAYY